MIARCQTAVWEPFSPGRPVLGRCGVPWCLVKNGFSGGGGSASSGWHGDGASKPFSGTSTAETALIMGVNVNLINPA